MPLQHVLKRPDTYVGSIVDITEKQWIYNLEEDKLEHKEINYVPAFFKIFDEILVNAADNKIQDPLMNKINVNIDEDDGQISVYNNGKGIPIEIHEELNVYVPEILFGQLMTSLNYNDDEKKFTGGRNGLDAKSANTFSTKFTVETIDMAREKKYVQSFYKNMTKTDKPKITAYNKKEECTKISFNPDFEKLGMSKLTNDTIALLNKHVYDIAGTVKNVKVFLNNKHIQVKIFEEYVQMYLKSVDAGSSKTNVVHEKFGEHWEVSIVPSVQGQFQQAGLFEETLGIIDGAKRNTINVEKLEDASNAGTDSSSDCTLVLVEGDIAKKFDLSGFSIVGCNDWGVYLLRGKLLNVHDATVKQISENEEIQALKQTLGLQCNKQYDSVNELRYGKLMIMTDPDPDGSHIKGLIINFFDNFYPSLLRQPGFLHEFITLIIECPKNNNTISFFTLAEYEEWKRHNDDGRGEKQHEVDTNMTAAGLWLRDLDALEAAWNECLIRHSSTDNDDDHHQQPHNNKEEPDRRKRRRNNGGGATYA
ncbi:14385_t:CDS:2 [Entrophospora sp. SA101]|nr:14385_t:CDS:2 [Entrophospora sp. SA101]